MTLNLLDTRLTREYGVRYPFVSAGMAFVALPPLVTAVCNAGGIGVLGAAPEPPPATEARIQAIKAGTPHLFGVNFIIDSAGGQDFTTRAHIDVCIAEGVRLVVFHWNLPPREWIHDLHAAGARVWLQAGSLDFAREALAAGADGLIAQGKQAAGHNRSTTPTSLLVKQLRREAGSTLILAAGGIADGATAAHALRHGADGVWVGTRMVASVEAYAHPGYKQRLVEGGEDDSRFTTLFGPEWPGQRQRVLRNRVVHEWAGREERIPNPPPPPAAIGTTVLFPGVVNVPYVMPKFSAFAPTPDTDGDLEEMDMPAGGASMELIQDILPASQLVTSMMEAAREHLEHSTTLVEDEHRAGQDT
ncbi:NAD(P)H-dependent flavin oxidoreductase [Archangium lansingense]|uniref:Nitronate monooxygenase n=1 Tax=Archangium lansingense TaxID=2995310 RepID=A0ABT4AIV3_9BACT|nr:nitronate monooxygenase [Archangium lansinium]MCY1081616.1 nitronate monooxygenase [Archangium lansinium]